MTSRSQREVHSNHHHNKMETQHRSTDNFVHLEDEFFSSADILLSRQVNLLTATLLRAHQRRPIKLFLTYKPFKMNLKLKQWIKLMFMVLDKHGQKEPCRQNETIPHRQKRGPKLIFLILTEKKQRKQRSGKTISKRIRASDLLCQCLGKDSPKTPFTIHSLQ